LNPLQHEKHELHDGAQLPNCTDMPQTLRESRVRKKET
jgi:hypothetical protein